MIFFISMQFIAIGLLFISLLYFFKAIENRNLSLKSYFVIILSMSFSYFIWIIAQQGIAGEINQINNDLINELLVLIELLIKGK